MNPLFVKTSGNKNAEPLVMIHGWGMNSGAWKTVRPALEAEYFMHWVDLPGYGVNSDVFANSMEDIVEVIIPHIPDNSHLLGWSLGGLVAQAIAESIQKKQPNKLKSLTLVASSPKFSQADDWQHAISHDVLSNFSKNLQDDAESTLKHFVALQFMGVKGTKELQRSLIDEIIHNASKHKTDKNRGGGKNSVNNAHYQALSLGLEILKNADYRKATYKLPQHWVLAERDRLILPTVINDLKFLRPEDQITLLENTSHAPFMTKPDEFIICMNSFIKKHT